VARTLTLRLDGPAGLEDTVFLGTAGEGISEVTVDGKAVAFYVDPESRLAHGKVIFKAQPITLVVQCAADGISRLPELAVPPDELTREILSKR
jgi:hypothetical protein